MTSTIAGDRTVRSRPRVRVALLTTSVDFGGIERVVLNLLQHMDPEVELMPLVFTRTDTSQCGFFDRLHAIGAPFERLYVNSIRPALVAAPIANLAQLIALFRKHRFDLIHSHGYRADIFALVLAKCFSLPVISTCHGFTPADRRLRIWGAIDARALRWFTRVMAVSAQMKQDLIDYGVSADRIRVITNAVAEIAPEDQARARRDARTSAGVAEDEFVFGYVGRLSPEKGVEYLVDAFSSFAEGRNHSRLLIVGDGPERQALERRAGERRIADRIIFAGFQSDTAGWYSVMDAFVLPSLTEGTPMALLEAMAHRVPVIASAVGGVPAVVDNGDSGMLVPSGDVAQLATAMHTMATTPSLRETLSSAAVRSIRRSYDVRRWASAVRDLYAETLENGVGVR